MKKFSLFFILSLCVAFAITHYSFKRLSEDYYSFLAYETEIMNDAVKERFDLYLNSSHIVGFISADVFSNKESLRVDYENLGKKITTEFHEILGFNLLNPEGKIIKVFPEIENKNALSKVTQNLPYIQESIKKGEPYWFSPPFPLFQGETGFAFYVPIFQDKKLSGWIAPLLSNRLFFERFKSSKFLNKYHLVVRDVETGLDYFSTSEVPQNSPSKYFQSTSNIFGRPVAFYSWPINPSFDYQLPWYLSLLISVIISALLTLIYKLIGQRQETKYQLEKIKAMINFTAKEASTSLMGIYKELNLMGKETGYVSTDKVSKYVSYISNLLAQISVSEKISQPSQMLITENVQVLPLLQEQLQLFSDRLSDKGVTVNIDESPLANTLEVHANKWLLCHSVLGNILHNIVFYVSNNSEIKVTFLQDDNQKMISFYYLTDKRTSVGTIEDEVLDRCLAIAFEVAKLSHGSIDVIDKPVGGRTIVLKFEK